MRRIVIALGCLALSGPALADSLSPGQSGTGVLSSSNAKINDTYYDCVPLMAHAGQTVVVTMTSTDFDSVLYVGHGSDCASMTVDERNDDGPQMGHNSQVTVTIEGGETYWLRPSTWSYGATGSYTLSATVPGGNANAPTVFHNNFRLN
ncbi:MAG: hypothetical protein IOB84_10600 [Brevundimonas sp.]|nr:hypothetical protein [Brevundimonas sp.]